MKNNHIFMMICEQPRFAFA